MSDRREATDRNPHQRRPDKHGHHTDQEATDSRCIQLPTPQIVVMAVVMPVCHRGSLCPQGRPRQAMPLACGAPRFTRGEAPADSTRGGGSSEWG